MVPPVMRGRELLPLARSLVRPGAGEPFSRTAINRAYYAAFGEAEEYVKGRGFRRRGGRGSHQQVWKHLDTGVSDNDAVRRAERNALAAQGLLLKEHREKADYRRHERVSVGEARAAHRDAEGFVKRLDALTA